MCTLSPACAVLMGGIGLVLIRAQCMCAPCATVVALHAARARQCMDIEMAGAMWVRLHNELWHAVARLPHADLVLCWWLASQPGRWRRRRRRLRRWRRWWRLWWRWRGRLLCRASRSAREGGWGGKLPLLLRIAAAPHSPCICPHAPSPRAHCTIRAPAMHCAAAWPPPGLVVD